MKPSVAAYVLMLVIVSLLIASCQNRPSMGRIILEVNQELAKKWKNSTEEQQARLIILFSRGLELLSSSNISSSEPTHGYARPSEKKLKEHRNQVKQNLENHLQRMDELSLEAFSNGLTLEILEQILPEND